ncbi:unnamed protein product [Peniophora sp. CBMAI 1063]|nr:unnamed protein product [Peniophora sp. CBMAI 1063]
MLELKESLAEWKSVPDVHHIDDGASAADRRPPAQRALIARGPARASVPTTPGKDGPATEGVDQDVGGGQGQTKEASKKKKRA